MLLLIVIIPLYALSILMIGWPAVALAASRMWYSLFGTDFDALVKSKARMLLAMRIIGGILLATSIYLTLKMIELQHSIDSFDPKSVGLAKSSLGLAFLK
ncbi:MAG: hypothetical protein KDA54_05960 [Phycisphaerales bacterium]|nr:hypothetical protein [Phycisphaerales bacterium]